MGVTSNVPFSACMNDEPSPELAKALQSMVNTAYEQIKEAHQCVQTGKPCGTPCFHGCPYYSELKRID